MLTLRVCSIKARHENMTTYLSPVNLFFATKTQFGIRAHCARAFFFSLLNFKKHHKESLKRAKE